MNSTHFAKLSSAHRVHLALSLWLSENPDAAVVRVQESIDGIAGERLDRLENCNAVSRR